MTVPDGCRVPVEAANRRAVCPAFSAEFARQSKLASQADIADTNMSDSMDEALSDLDGWAA